MQRTIVYVKAEKNSKVKQKKVYLKDVCAITCSNPLLKNKLNLLLIYDFGDNKRKKQEKTGRIGLKKDSDRTNNTNRAVISILKVIELIQKTDNAVEIVSLGESDCVIEYIRDKKERKIWIVIKVIFVSAICFFGTAFTIMAFHNDINVTGLFESVYGLFGLSYKGGAGALEIGYSIGLGVGIIVFYNHVGKRRITKDPTPLEVEMRIYEDDVNQTLIDTADREGIEVDVS